MGYKKRLRSENMAEQEDVPEQDASFCTTGTICARHMIKSIHKGKRNNSKRAGETRRVLFLSARFLVCGGDKQFAQKPAGWLRETKELLPPHTQMNCACNSIALTGETLAEHDNGRNPAQSFN